MPQPDIIQHVAFDVAANARGNHPIDQLAIAGAPASGKSTLAENLRDAFRLRKKMHVRELRVLLIDDVLTTGSTLSECARVLKEAGALSVHAATAARA